MHINGRAQEIEDAFNKAAGDLLNVVHFEENFNNIHHIELDKASISISKKIKNNLRQQAYVAGRLLVNRCFVDLSLTPVMIPQHTSGAPIWPDNVTGSIAHCNQYAIAVLANIQDQKDKIGIGIDVEALNRTPPSIWPTIFTQNEIEFLQNASPINRNHLAACIFSAKEAFYKAQFPITEHFLEYDELEVRLDPSARSGKLQIRHQIHALKPYHASAFYYTYPTRVMTGVVIKVNP